MLRVSEQPTARNFHMKRIGVESRDITRHNFIRSNWNIRLIKSCGNTSLNVWWGISHNLIGKCGWAFWWSHFKRTEFKLRINRSFSDLIINESCSGTTLDSTERENFNHTSTIWGWTIVSLCLDFYLSIKRHAWINIYGQAWDWSWAGSAGIGQATAR